MVGTGIDRPAVVPVDEVAPRLDLLGDYVVYVGRIEPEKGCAVMIDHFLRWQRETRATTTLALFGRSTMSFSENAHVRLMGVVPDGEKLAAIARARALVMPSRHESLSMVVLEAWMMGRPVLVNGDCEVLRGQVLRANGGLYYRRYEEFAAAMDLLVVGARPRRPRWAARATPTSRRTTPGSGSWRSTSGCSAPGRVRGAAVRLAFVIQRYGLEVNGGAELHCRWLAERLARRHQVEVFATRALDYLEWKNHYPRGTEVVNGIPVHRSTVRRTRNARVFASLSQRLLPRDAHAGGGGGLGARERALLARPREGGGRGARAGSTGSSSTATATTTATTACPPCGTRRSSCRRPRRTRRSTSGSSSPSSAPRAGSST